LQKASLTYQIKKINRTVIYVTQRQVFLWDRVYVFVDCKNVLQTYRIAQDDNSDLKIFL